MPSRIIDVGQHAQMVKIHTSLVSTLDPVVDRLSGGYLLAGMVHPGGTMSSSAAHPAVIVLPADLRVAVAGH
jgi:hypothetical protein